MRSEWPCHLLRGKVRGHRPPFFMTITITVDGDAIPNDWQAQQTSDPMAEVDLFVLSDDMTTSYPTSAPAEEEGGGGDENAGRSSKKGK